MAVGGQLPPGWESVEWLRDLIEVPDNATWPRLMSPPHPRAVGSLGWGAIARIEARREADPLTPDRAKHLRWWQRLLIVRMLEVDEAGELVWRKVLVSTSRQVGKSVGLREIALDRIAQADHYGEPQLVLHVAKDLMIADEIQRPARQWAGMVGHPWHGVGANGRWAVEFDGVRGRWLVRAQSAVYGYSASVVLVDEAWAIDEEHITEGVEPTMIEREQPQLLMVSTAHSEATPLFPGLRKQALGLTASSDPDLLLVEWSAPPGAEEMHAAAHRMASPHWDPRRARFIASKVGQPGFTEQWLNVWPDTAGEVLTMTTSEVIAALGRPELTISPTAPARTYVLYPDLKQSSWHVIAGALVEEVAHVLYVGQYRTQKAAVEEIARAARQGTTIDLLTPRHLRGRIPRLPGVRSVTFTNESDLMAAATAVRPLLSVGKVLHNGAATVVEQMAAAVVEQSGETYRITAKGSNGPVEVAKAVTLAAWWVGRQDRPSAVVV